MNTKHYALIFALSALLLNGCSQRYPSDAQMPPPPADNPYTDSGSGETQASLGSSERGSDNPQDHNNYGDFYDDPKYGVNVVAGPTASQRDRVIYFAFDSSQLDKRSVNVLKSHAQYLRTHPATHVVLEGHTDQRGTSDYNIALGERRAYAVKDWLQRAGVNGTQMRVLSYGATRPAAFCLAERCYQRNRRVVIDY